MKNMKKKLLSIFVVMMLVLTLKYGQVYAQSSEVAVTEPEYTDEYKKYLELSEEEREKVLEPLKYKISGQNAKSNNYFGLSNLLRVSVLRASITDDSYSLQEDIPENVKIRDQGTTNSCWNFAMLGALETNLAKLNKSNNKPTIEYDFSERHAMYATTNAAFTNGDKNKYGYNKGVNDGGSWLELLSYLTNGSGAIPEEEMQFSNNVNNINIADIQNKTISSTVEEAVILNIDNEQTIETSKQKIKDFILNYGGVYTGIRVPDTQTFDNFLNWEYYNKDTGALYCNSEDLVNHAVLIVGWDDTYDESKFNSLHQPSTPGAWIIKNSWGEKQDTGYTLTDYKQALVDNGQFESINEISDATMINALEQYYGIGKVSINGTTNHVMISMGNDGYLYVSYEDIHIYTELIGIKKSEDTKNYDTIYQNDLLLTGMIVTFQAKENKQIVLANVFSRDSSKTEAIDKISIFSPGDYTYKVYVNPNNSDKSENNLRAVTLKTGTSQRVEPGYGVIEFDEPISLTGESFVVAVEILNQTNPAVALEYNDSRNERTSTVEVNEGESYIKNRNNSNTDWYDLVNLPINDSSTMTPLPNVGANLTIKAFTKLAQTPKTVTSIAVTNLPTKTSYTQNSNEELDLTGGIITVTYSDETTEEISMTNSNVTHSEFDISRAGMQTITLTYEGRTATFNISIQATQETPKTVTSIAVTNLPAKTSYTQNSNEELDLTGGIITVTYSDETTEEISMTNSNVTHSEFDISRAGTQTITLTYEGRTATFNISVQASQVPEPTKTVTSIAVKTKPTKTTYVQGIDRELNLAGGVITVTYSDETTEDINMTNSGVTYTGFDTSRTGEQTITLTYKGRTTTFKVTLQEPEKQPKSSDFGDAEAAITKAKLYMYSSSDKETKYEINIEISGAKIGDSEDTYTYYYYLSPSENKTNIKDNEWTKINAKNITKNNDGTFSINLEINITDLENYSDFENAESLYVYVKEVASINNENVTKINVLEIDVEDIGEEELEELLEFYIDDKYIGNMEDLEKYIEEEFNKEEPKQSEAKEEQKEDDTTKRETLPAAGVLSVLSIIVVIGMLATIQYLKYRNIDR